MTCCLVVSPTWIFAIFTSLAKSALPIETHPDSTMQTSINEERRFMLGLGFALSSLDFQRLENFSIDSFLQQA
jgi:hypothetical protein